MCLVGGNWNEHDFSINEISWLFNFPLAAAWWAIQARSFSDANEWEEEYERVICVESGEGEFREFWD